MAGVSDTSPSARTRNGTCKRLLGRKATGLLALLLGVVACSSEPAANPAADPCEPPALTARPGDTLQIMLPMRDCVRLGTNVHFPREGAGPWPVILVRTPYGKGGDEHMPLDFTPLLFSQHRVVIVNQDTRGRFSSEGEFVPFVHERADGADTMAWIEQQPWFNGKLAVWGASYLGFTALMNMAARPDLVSAAVLHVTRSDLYGTGFENGIIRADTSGNWLLWMAERDAVSFHGEDVFERAILEFPLNEGDRRTIGESHIDDYFLENRTRNRWYLDALDPDEIAALDTPVYLMGGWFDFMVGGMLDDWDRLFARRAGQDMYLTVGPWTHLMGVTPDHDYPFPDAESIVHDVARQAAFLDHYLRPEDRDGSFDAVPVRYYDGGAGAWQRTRRLWPAATVNLDFYAAGATASVDCSGGAVLSAAAPISETVATWTYDPYEPIWMAGGLLIDFERWGMRREIDWCAEPAALSFETAPLTTPVELAGTPEVQLRVASSAADTVFATRLYLVDTDGRAYNLREGAMLLSHREGNAEPVAYTPGSRVTLRIPLPPLRWTLQPGQRLGLVVTSSMVPFIVPHTNVAGDWTAVRDPLPAQQTVIAGSGDGATRLRLPIASN